VISFSLDLATSQTTADTYFIGGCLSVLAFLDNLESSVPALEHCVPSIELKALLATEFSGATSDYCL
jgi:hypothetical protein